MSEIDHYNKLKDKIIHKKAIVGVVGLGYVGTAVSLGCTSSGYTTFGFDINTNKVASINQKKIPNLVAYRDMSHLEKCDVICICVSTPLDEQKKPALGFLEKALLTIKTYLKSGKLIIVESSVGVGTTKNLLLPILQQSGLKHGTDFFLAFSPERIDPGNKKFTFKTIPKVVSGIDQKASDLAVTFYKNIVDSVIPVSSTETAEFSKILENVFRLVNISLINELADYASALGIDMWEVVSAAATKPFGFLAHFPGPGVGGECIPVLPYYLLDDAEKRNLPLKMVKTATVINEKRIETVFKKAVDIINNGKIKNNPKALLIGVAYKPESTDIRESAAIKIWKKLEAEGFSVAYHDPYVARVNGAISVNISENELEQQDLIIIATSHKNINYSKIVNSQKPVLDTVNALSDFKSSNVTRL